MIHHCFWVGFLQGRLKIFQMAFIDGKQSKFQGYLHWAKEHSESLGPLGTCDLERPVMSLGVPFPLLLF